MKAVTMRTRLQPLLAFALLACVGAAAAQPAPKPAPEASTTQQPQGAETPRLNLRLNEKDLRSAIPYSPNAGDKKQEGAQGLPGLGGKPSTSWDQPTPEQVVPKSSDIQR
jgi:hypothetical protein